MPRIAIIGPGAIGGTIAVWLNQAGRHDITLCSRRPIDELRVETPAGLLSIRPQVCTDPAQAAAVDFALVTTKSYDASATAKWLAKLATADTTVAILQNGVEHRERFSPYLRAEQILPTVVWISAERPEPARIVQRSPAKLTVPDGARGREFAGLFAGTPIEVTLSADFRSVAWRKLCGNSPGVLNTLLLQPTRVLQDEAIGRLAMEIVRECAAVGRAEGAVISDDVAEAVVQALRGIPPDSVNSMQADREAGRPLELDARNGVIVRLGRKHSIPTPCNEMAVALLAALEKRPERV